METAYSMVNAQEENTAMTAESIFQEIKEALSGRPGQPIVLGVCQAVAARFRQEVWLVRLVTIVFAIVWTFPIMAIYILLGFFLPETEDRSRGFFRGLGVVAHETARKVTDYLGRLFNSRGASDRRHSSY